jgi:predicted negative regulator of RcsB-dependent stress response
MADSDQNSPDQKQVSHAYGWLADHGQVDYEQLVKLAQAGTPEAIERLHELADDNNISYGEATDPLQLAEEISRAMEVDGNAGVE